MAASKRITCVCLGCATPFLVYPSRIRLGEGKYCSRACMKRVVSCVCLGCSVTFTVRPSEIRKGEGKYCSKACYEAHRPRMPLADRFWSSVEKTDDCWLWQGRVNNKGYGLFFIRGRQYMLVHRFSYELAHGTIMPTVLCLHHCDRPICVNPEHLYLGSQADNVRDMMARNRSGPKNHPERMARGEQNGTHTHPEKVRRGSDNPQSKLTDAKVREIRQMHASKQWTRKQIGAYFGVGKSAIDKVLARQVWKHVDD